jgi:hypothetical protein
MCVCFFFWFPDVMIIARAPRAVPRRVTTIAPAPLVIDNTRFRQFPHRYWLQVARRTARMGVTILASKRVPAAAKSATATLGSLNFQLFL